MTPLELLVDNYKLETEFLSGHVQHTTLHFRSDSSRGGRQVAAVKGWYRGRELGRGQFGTVFLERSEEGEHRTVKDISKSKNSKTRIDYRRELVAMVVLTKVRDMECPEPRINFFWTGLNIW